MANSGRVLRVVAALVVALASSAAGAATSGLYEDDPMGLVASRPELSTNSLGAHDWQVWLCEVPGGSLAITAESAAVALDEHIAPYLIWLSEGHYQPTFTPVGTVSAPRNACITEVIRNADDTGATGAVIVTNEARDGGLSHPGVWCPSTPCAGLSTTYPANHRSVLLDGRTLHGTSPRIMTAAHEIGHSFHLGHSFTGQTTGTWAEYDNRLDILSGGTGDRTELIGTLAINRYAAGWLGEDQIAIAGPGDEITLGPIGGNGLQLAAYQLEPGVATVFDVRVRKEFDSDLGPEFEGVTVHSVDETHGCGISLCIGINRRVKPLVGGPYSASHVLAVGESIQIGPGVIVDVIDQIGDDFTIRFRDSAPPTWADGSELSAEVADGVVMLSWPAATDDSEAVSYEVRSSRETQTVEVESASVAVGDDELEVIEVVPIDASGNRGRTLALSIRPVADGVGIAAHDPLSGKWSIRSSDGSLSEIYFGVPGDLPMMCDWNGDGVATVGLYRPSNGFLYLRNENSTGFADHAFFYGIPDDRPVCGDWNGDGTETIGIYRPGEKRFYLRNTNTQGFADSQLALGGSDPMPLAGDWSGAGFDRPGVLDSDGRLLYLGGVIDIGSTGRRWVTGGWGSSVDSLADFGPAGGPYHVGVDGDVLGLSRSSLFAGSF